MAILHSNRARPGRVVSAGYLDLGGASPLQRVCNGQAHLQTDSGSMRVLRNSNLDPGPTSRAKRDRAQGVGTKEQRAIRLLNPPEALCPCDRCPQAAICCDLQLACRAFSKFVRGVQWKNAARSATHKRYLQLFASQTSGVPPC